MIPVLAMTAACAVIAVPSSASAASDAQQASSENWSGYVAGASAQGSSQQFKSVSGSWVAPTAKCTSGQGYSAFWVGLGGADQSADSSQYGSGASGSSTSLEQAGTEADCDADGSAAYFAWYELVPSPPVKINMTVTPGDRMSAKVTVSGNTATITVSDQTTGASFTKTLAAGNPDVSTAEWIAEAPSSCDQTDSSCTPLPLTDFGTVNFTGATATSSDGHTGTISDSDWTDAVVSLVPGASSMGFGAQFTSDGASQSSTAAATPSALSSDGSSFSVAWSADSSQSSDTSGSAGSGDGYGSGSGYGDPSGGYGTGGYGYGGSGYGGSGYGDPSGGYGDGYGAGGYGDGAGGYGDGGYGYGYGGYGGGGYAYLPGGVILAY